MSVSSLLDCCQKLDSQKVTERKRNAELLEELLENKSILNTLSKPNSSVNWDDLVEATNKYVIRETNKLLEAELKNRKSGPNTFNGDVLVNVVKRANTAEYHLNLSKILNYVFVHFETASRKKLLANTYFVILADYILPLERNCGRIDKKDWLNLFYLSKEVLEKFPNNINEIKVLTCIHHILKFGPKHQFPGAELRKNFEFILGFSKGLKETSSRQKLQLILNINLEFCLETSEDTRMCCCKFGEDLMPNLLTFYQLSCCNNNKLKILVHEFLLLQMKIHHPKGSTKNTLSAYAFSWSHWQISLETLYFILYEEIDQMQVDQWTKFKPECNLLEFHDVCMKLAVEVFKQVFHENTSDGLGCEPQPSKKAKREIGISFLITHIQNSKKWSWIKFITLLIKKYNPLSASDFLNLLQVLLELQSETKEANSYRHIYECLCVLSDVQDSIKDLNQTNADSLWLLVWDCALRAAGLNQDEEVTHKLMGSLIRSQRIKKTNLSQLYQIYISKVLNVNKFTLNTLNIGFKQSGFPEIVQLRSVSYKTREVLLEWILKPELEDLEFFSDKITGEILVKILLKQWPVIKVHEKTEQETDKGIEDLYFITTFDAESLVDKNEEKNDKNPDMKKNVVNNDMLNKLIDSITKIIDETLKSTNLEALINTLTLTGNIISYMVDFDIINQIEDFVLTQKIESIFCRLLETFLNYEEIDKKSKILMQIDHFVSQELNPKVAYVIRKLFPIDLLQVFVSLLNSKVEDLIEDRTIAMRILCDYACVPNLTELHITQQRILKTLATFEYNFNDTKDYKMVCTFLNSVWKCSATSFPEKLLDLTLELVRSLAEAHYTNYESALIILEVLKKLFKHISLCDSAEIKNNAISLLMPFVEMNEAYGPAVSENIIDCLVEIVRFDTDLNWARWDDKPISVNITKFLISDFQRVRLAAVEALAEIFKKSLHIENRGLYSIELQEEVFADVFTKCNELFCLKGNFSQEQQVDETVTRTCSVLYTYTYLLCTNSFWRQKSLYSLITLVNTRKLHIDSTLRAINLVAKHLKYKDAKSFLEDNLRYVTFEWFIRNHSMETFPYSLLKCDCDTEFLEKYVDILLPVYLVENRAIIQEICNNQGKSYVEFVNVHYPELISKYFAATNTQNLNESMQFILKYSTTLEELLPAGLNSVIQERSDELITSLIKLVSDDDHFRNNFRIDVALPQEEQPHFTVSSLTNALIKIQTLSPSNESIIRKSIKRPEKIQKVMLNLSKDMFVKHSLEEKLKSFHHFTVFIDLIMEFLQEEKNISLYVTRSVSYTLLHLIVAKEESSNTLNVAACIYLHKFLQGIFASNIQIFDQFFVIFVSSLTRIAKSIGDACLKLLDFLIVENGKRFENTIALLDPFPDEDLFRKHREMYRSIKYSTRTYSLEEEIEMFLSTGELLGKNGNRIEGLKHLKELLSGRKTELGLLYKNIEEIADFSDVSNKSIMHKLIYALIKLSTSVNEEESLEATRCLGECGPADLITMVLHTEKDMEIFNYKGFELVTRKILTLLNDSLLDYDINIVKAASNALYEVLSFKEANRVLASLLKEKTTSRSCHYLYPFISTNNLKTGSKFTLNPSKLQTLSSISLWNFNSTHQEWITTLTTNLIEIFDDKCYLTSLKPVCFLQVDFCERVFPLLVYIILYNNIPNFVSVISHQINTVFSNLFLITNNSDNVIERESVQCMFDVVNLIRIQDSLSDKKSMGTLQLNYLHVAQASEFCSDPFSALLYVELWCQERIIDISMQNASINTSSFPNVFDIICKYENEDTVTRILNILTKCYQKIGEVDAVNSLGSLNLLSKKQLIEHNKHLKLWDQVALRYNFEVIHGDLNSTSRLQNSLKNSALFSLPLLLNGDDTTEDQYECFWRLGRWDLTDLNQTERVFYERGQYFALKALHDNDFGSFDESIAEARRSVIDAIKVASLESTKNLYGILMQLESLLEMEDFAHGKKNDSYQIVIDKWRVQDRLVDNEFQFIEPIRAQRIALLKDTLNVGENLKDNLIEMLLSLTDFARRESNNNVAFSTLDSLSNLANLPEEISNRIHLEEAQVYWSINKATAMSILRQLLNKNLTPRLRGVALKIYGTWNFHMQSQNPHSIIKDYFLESLSTLNGIKNDGKDEEIIQEAYITLAQCADKQYQRLSTYIKSATFECKIRNMEKSKKAAADIKNKKKNTDDERRAIILYERQSTIDENEINNAHMEKNTYLILAVKYYLKHLQGSTSNDICVFRILSLWLENRNNQQLAQLMHSELSKILSYKFVPVLPQLIPHISNTDDMFSKTISRLIRTCASDHPHHTLPIILSVSNSTKDKQFDKTQTNTEGNEPRIIEAKKILAELLQKGPMKQLIQRMIKVSDALIKLAYYTSNEEYANGTSIPNSYDLHSIKDFHEVLLPTCVLPINMNCKYEKIVGIYGFGKKYFNVGGINAPKRITCIGTDGVTRMQLLKGKDDLRQDAVMQQVFTVMNNLFYKEKRTNLSIRTYKIVPLSQRSGILEWLETLTIGKYLTDAHPKYNPNDMSLSECRTQFKRAANTSNEKKLEIFNKILKKFHPVLHMFFVSNFLQAADNYERQRAFKISVATTSMCGYVLGIGDRHVQNMLLDKTTAEIIHIDFGIAFEQGKLLPTPETVPFRLTRDIEDGMGVLGTEGVFRRACEKTMEVLRSNTETILAIIEVLLYDPLYSWTITPAQAYSRQFRKETEGNLSFSDQEKIPVNITAERALLRLKQKLTGTEEGNSSSIEGQVERLIKEARDPANLCRLYIGWQPYL